MMIESVFYKIGKIGGMYYTSDLSRLRTMVVYGIGAPITPDNGNLPDAKNILSFGVDLFVPDYIGYGRSDGVFTPKNCIKTFLNLFEYFQDGVWGVNNYSLRENRFKYQKIIFIGRSLGGAYIPLLPKFNQSIHDLGIFCPAVNQKAQGSVEGEESNEDFMRSMEKDGYHHLYRGILKRVWQKHLENEDGLSPVDNIDCLKDAKLYIAHGKKDKCIHYSKSVDYYKQILLRYPEGIENYKLKLYEDGDHGFSTTNKGVVDFLKWLGLKRKMVK